MKQLAGNEIPAIAALERNRGGKYTIIHMPEKALLFFNRQH